MEEKNLDKVFTIPNILSFCRVLLVPFIMWAYFTGRHYLCAAIVVVSFLTDVADGIIARKFNMVSALGKALDPIADKLTLLSLLICISVDRHILYLLLGVFIIKEVCIGVEGLILLKLTGTTYSAKWYGKVTTFVLYALAIVLVLFKNLPQIAVTSMLYTCIFANVLSLVLYSIMNIKRIVMIKRGEDDQTE